MYTLRIISKGGVPAKQVDNTDLGSYYTVIYDVKAYDEAINDKEVYAVIDADRAHKHIMYSDFACIMTESGKTFEVLHKGNN